MSGRLVSLLALFVLAAGCGGGAGGGTPEATEGTSSGADFELFASEYSFAPPFLLFEKPGEYTISLRNDGSEAHDFTLKDVGAIPAVSPGETKTGTFTLKPGEYEYFCSIGDHAEQGMTGTINVLAP